MAAEIRSQDARRCARPGRFNEAAANGRGNRLRRRCFGTCSGSGFNEAAANGRGNLGAAVPGRRSGGGFNEAAANGRGNRRGREV